LRISHLADSAPRRATHAGAPAPSNVVPFPRSGLDPRLVILIGEHLRAMYSELVRQPVPDRFLQLLEPFDDRAGEKHCER
jgi:hypothetical protein